MHRFNVSNVIASTALCILAVAQLANAESQVRIKDIATLEGERTNQLTGMGLVTGLAGTGGNTPNTRILAANLVQRLGNRIDPFQRGDRGYWD